MYYISGGPVESFTQKLEKIARENELQEKFQEKIVEAYSQPINNRLLDFLSNFSDFERSIMFLMLLGFSVKEVSEYKGISIVRIKQSVSAIRNHTIWENFYGIKEKLQR